TRHWLLAPAGVLVLLAAAPRCVRRESASSGRRFRNAARDAGAALPALCALAPERRRRGMGARARRRRDRARARARGRALPPRAGAHSSAGRAAAVARDLLRLA